MQFRIGLNQGDVLSDGERLFGDGINVAARIQAIAPAGRVALSEKVYNEVRDRCRYKFTTFGEHKLKNIPRPVTVYVLGAPPAAIRTPAASATSNKPSIAILPFTTLVTDPDQNFLADGIVEDLSTSLSRMRWLFVTARSSSQGLKAQMRDVREVGRILGVRYVLDGSVRQSGKRCRVTSQLVDAETGQHIWAEKFDRLLTDIFELQDELVEQVSAAIEPRIYAEEVQRAKMKPPGNLDSWGAVVRALSLVFKHSRLANAEAQRLAREAIALDPSYARAHAVLAWALLWQGHCYWAEDVQRTYHEAVQTAEHSIALDPSEPWGRVSLSHILSARGDHNRAISESENALALQPSFALAHTIYGWALLRAGRFEAAVEETGKALRLSPLDDFSGLYSAVHGLSLLAASRFDEALPWIRRGVSSMPEFIGNWRLLASCCGHLGLLGEAADALAHAEALKPGITLSMTREHLIKFAHRDTFLAGLAKAGVPE